MHNCAEIFTLAVGLFLALILKPFLQNLSLMPHFLSQPLLHHIQIQITPSVLQQKFMPRPVTFPQLVYSHHLLWHLFLPPHLFSYINLKISSRLCFTTWVLVNLCYIIPLQDPSCPHTALTTSIPPISDPPHLLTIPVFLSLPLSQFVNFLSKNFCSHRNDRCLLYTLYRCSFKSDTLTYIL